MDAKTVLKWALLAVVVLVAWKVLTDVAQGLAGSFNSTSNQNAQPSNVGPYVYQANPYAYGVYPFGPPNTWWSAPYAPPNNPFYDAPAAPQWPRRPIPY